MRAVAVRWLVLIAAAVSAAPPAADGSVTEQLDPAHTGVSPTPLGPPLRERWRRTLDGSSPLSHTVRHVLTGDGRVYVTSQPERGTRELLALSPATGATLWRREVTDQIIGAGYAPGRVLVGTRGGLMAVDAATGEPVWTRTTWPGLSDPWVENGPVVEDGIAYVTIGVSAAPGHLFAVNVADGTIRWSRESDRSRGVAVAGERVYYNDDSSILAASRTTGAVAWSTAVDDSLFGRVPPAVAGGRVYVPGAPQGAVLDAETGRLLHRPWIAGMPAVDGERAYVPSGEPDNQRTVLHTLRASDGASLWELGGWKGITSHPLVAGDTVYATGTDLLYGMDRSTGRLTWCTRTRTRSDGPWHTKLALGEGLLLVPSGGEIAAYEPGGTPGCAFYDAAIPGYRDPIDGLPTATAAARSRAQAGRHGGFVRDGRAGERWLARAADHALVVGPTGPTLTLPLPERLPGARTAVHLTLRGGRAAQRIRPERPLPGVVNDFSGPDPAGWRTGRRRFARLRLVGVRPGIDLVVREGRAARFEYDVVVRPGADPRDVVLDFAGAGRPELDDRGRLVLSTPAGTLRQSPPVAYQRARGLRIRVPARFALTADGGVRFVVGRHDPRRTLVIDPVLEWATYLGGGLDDAATDVTSDASGNVYVVGTTSSRDLPVSGAFDGWDERTALCWDSVWPCRDAFVAKYDASGGLVQVSYLSGRRDDVARAVATDASGSVYVAGNTVSPNFPVRSAFQSAWRCGGAYGDAFVAKLSADGRSLAYSTYLGGCMGFGDDAGSGIAVDGQGRAVVTGWTSATEFPTTDGAADRSCTSDRFCHDGFVARLSASGAALEWSTLFGGSRSEEQPADVALDGQGRPVITGFAAGWATKDFPWTPGSYDTDPATLRTEVFAARLAADGSAWQWATAFGGEDHDFADELALDADGDVHLVGSTRSRDFPTSEGALDRTCDDDPYEYSCATDSDAFALELSADGSRLLASTFVGGRGYDRGTGIALDAAGRAYVAGATSSARSFPLTDPFQSEVQENREWCAARWECSDAFVVRLDATKSRAEYGTLYGGIAHDFADGVALAGGDAWIAGHSHSPDLKTAAAAAQPRWAGGNCDFIRDTYEYPSCSDAFVARIDEAKPPPASVPDGGSGTGTEDVSGRPPAAVPSPAGPGPAPRQGATAARLVARTLVLRRRGRRVSGRLRASAAACVRGASVLLERRRRTRWRRVRVTRTGARGRFTVVLPRGRARLRLRVPAVTRQDGGAVLRCGGVTRRVDRLGDQR